MEPEFALGGFGTYSMKGAKTYYQYIASTGNYRLIYARRFNLDRKTKQILAPIPEIIGTITENKCGSMEVWKYGECGSECKFFHTPILSILSHFHTFFVTAIPVRRCKSDSCRHRYCLRGRWRARIYYSWYKASGNAAFSRL